MNRVNLCLLSIILLASASCAHPGKVNVNKDFDTLIAGKQTLFFTLKNKNGMIVGLTNYGARAVSIVVPGKDGKPVDVAQGYDNIEGYLKSNDPYFGATVGRYANRISKGKFTINNKEYTLAINDICGPNHLHGGVLGFARVVWDSKVIGDSSVEFKYLSKDMEDGYPGNLDTRVTYTLTDSNSLEIIYEATTDAPTICNLTNHTYFNLNGAGSGDILSHVLFLNADSYTPIDIEQIPLGQVVKVKDTPFDFSTPAAIETKIHSAEDQIILGKGYDHNYVLNRKEEGKAELAATVYSPESGIMLEMYTDEPGVQFYSCGFQEGKDIGKGQKKYDTNGAFCLEAQHFPDSPNRPEFPSAILNPGGKYSQTTIYKFLTK